MTVRLVFDVESQGLYGEAMAVAWVVWDDERVLEEEFAICNPEAVVGGDSADVRWINENVYPWLRGMNAQFPEAGSVSMKDPTTEVSVTICADHTTLCEVFWRVWERWLLRGAEAWADVPVPVESNFLRSCVNASRPARKWRAPFPLYDVATLAHATGLGALGRKESEMPDHHPLMDARHSARKIVVALERIGRPL